jgi:ribosome biogenesis GTPase
MNGLIVRNTGSWYQVKLDDGRMIDCKIKGNFRLKDIKSTNPITVGDRVSIVDNEESTALIDGIEERKNYIIRRSSNLSKQSHIIASNLDQAFLIVTVNYPVTTTTFIDRFLVSAEAYRIPVSLIFNKIDRYNADDLEYLAGLIHLYETIGYSCYKISALQDDDLTLLEHLLKGKVTLLSGHSGVGKSTIINRILPGTNLKTGDISEYHNKGMHTTTFSEMLELPSGGYIIDTPGIKGFGLIDMEDTEVSHYFPEIFKVSEKCKFNNCTHRREPGCAVLESVENHYISNSRYHSYLNILKDREEGKYREAF